MSIREVPKDVLLYAASFLPLEDALNIKLVCKSWHEIGEKTAKPLIVKEFQNMINRASFLFQKMTGKTVYEFIPELKEKLDLSKFTSKTLHEYFETIPLKVQVAVERSCGLGTINPDFLFTHKIEEEDEKRYIHIRNRNSLEETFIDSVFHFPKELFEINEGEVTAFPLKGKLVICKAHQYEQKFEDVRKSLIQAPGHTNDHNPLTCYVWQKDAKRDSLISKSTINKKKKK